MGILGKGGKGKLESELADNHVNVRYCVVAMTTLYVRSQSHERMGNCIQHFIRLEHPSHLGAHQPKQRPSRSRRTQATRWHARHCPETLLHDQLRINHSKEYIPIDITTLNADVYETILFQYGKGWEGRNNPRHYPTNLQPFWPSSSPTSTPQNKKPKPHCSPTSSSSL